MKSDSFNSHLFPKRSMLWKYQFNIFILSHFLRRIVVLIIVFCLSLLVVKNAPIIEILVGMASKFVFFFGLVLNIKFICNDVKCLTNQYQQYKKKLFKLYEKTSSCLLWKMKTGANKWNRKDIPWWSYRSFLKQRIIYESLIHHYYNQDGVQQTWINQESSINLLSRLFYSAIVYSCFLFK